MRETSVSIEFESARLVNKDCAPARAEAISGGVRRI
jgi:hypothetical protein